MTDYLSHIAYLDRKRHSAVIRELIRLARESRLRLWGFTGGKGLLP